MEPDAAAQRRLADAYAANHESLHRLCRRLLRGREDAEDAVQEAFARAAGAILRGECEPAPYLHVTARNICFNLLQAHRRRDVELDAEECSTAPGPEAVALDRMMLSDAWSGLSARDRALLAQRFAGFAYDEIATRSGMSAKSVSVGLVRARARVRQAARRWAAAILVPLPWRAPWHGGLRRVRHAAAARMQRLLQPGVAELASLAGALALAGTPGAGAGVAGSAAASPAAATSAGLVGAARSDSANGLRAVTATPPPASRASAQARPVAALPAPPSPGLVSSVAGPHLEVLAASPDYTHDHTVFAGGRAPGCVVCGVLFTSTDGGAHWSQLPAVGYQGEAVSLSPDWAADHRMFSGTSLGLEESDDGGRTFSVVAPLPGPIAVTPDAAGGDRIVIASRSVLWSYRTATHGLSGGTPLPAQFLATSLLPDPDGVHVEVGGYREAALTTDAVVVRCAIGGGCGAVQVMPGAGGASLLAWPGAGACAMLAWTDSGDVYASSDSGATFGRLDMAGRRASAIAAGTRHGTAVVAVSYTTLSRVAPVIDNHLAYASPGSAALTDSAAPVPAFGVGPIALLPGGRILALQTQGGMSPVTYFSDDGGRGWGSSAG